MAILLIASSAIALTSALHPPAIPKAAPATTSHQVITFQYDCQASDPESLPCLQQHYQSVTQKQGVAAAFTQLKVAYQTDASVRSDCHQLTHTIGRTAADAARNVTDAYSQGDNFCWSGYYHGVMESVVMQIGGANLPAKLPTICAALKAQKPYSFYHYNCVHGLGHGIMDINGSDLFASLKLCDRLTDTWEQSSCYGGVFMENEMDEVNPNHTTAYLKADQPMYPCTAVATKYKNDCYLSQTSHALRLANENFAQVFAECAAVETPYQTPCYQSLGRDASGNSISQVAPTKASCMLGLNQDARQNCIIGAVKDFISYYHSDQQAGNLCQSLDASLQPICNTTKQGYYSTL